MAGKGGSRQQKQAAKAVRRRQAVAAKQQAERLASSLAGRVAAAASSPVDRCLRLRDMADAGIGHVILAKRLPSGALACGFFLVDLLCLGVKDVFYRELAPSGLDEWLAEMAAAGQVAVPIAPASAKALIIGAVAFAADCGLEPAEDHRTVFRLFDGIDVEAATEHFAFGMNGRPVYVPGPKDSPTRIRHIQRALKMRGYIDEGASNAEANLTTVKRFAAVLKERHGDGAMERILPGLTIEREGPTETDEARTATSFPSPDA